MAGTFSTLGTVGVGFGMILASLVGIVAFTMTLLWCAFTIFELPNLPRNILIRQRLSTFVASGFSPSRQFIKGGAGIAIDSAKREVFLANRRGNKLYGVDDISKVDSDFKKDQYQISGSLRISVRDLDNPLYEINAVFTGLSKLREIESLLLILREPQKTGVGET